MFRRGRIRPGRLRPDAITLIRPPYFLTLKRFTMKQTFFLILLMLVCCFGNAQTADTLQTYSTEAAACKGFQKSAARFRDQSGQSRAVVCDQSGNVFVVLYSCKRGFYRQPVERAAIAAAD